MMRLALFLCLLSVVGYAESWSGDLVDSKCFDNEERNVNPTDTLTYVDRDMNQEIRFCAPKAKTKTFALVRQDGLNYRLDSAGNAKAAELVRGIGKKSILFVAITGEGNGKIIRVNSISTPK